MEFGDGCTAAADRNAGDDRQLCHLAGRALYRGQRPGLISCLGLATGGRVWRIVSVAIAALLAAGAGWLAYEDWIMTAGTVRQMHLLDRSYFLTRDQTRLIWAMAAGWLALATSLVGWRTLKLPG